MHRPFKQSERERMTILVGEHDAVAGKEGVLALRISTVSDHHPTQQGSRGLNFFGVDDQSLEVVVKGFLFKTRSGSGFRHFEENLLEGGVTPGADVKR